MDTRYARYMEQNTLKKLHYDMWKAETHVDQHESLSEIEFLWGVERLRFPETEVLCFERILWTENSDEFTRKKLQLDII